MDHDYIERHQVVDRYVQGRLPQAEVDGFEEHYLDCDECLRRLDLAERFQRGLRQVAAEEAAGLTVLAALLRSRRAVYGTLLALLIVACGLLGWRALRLGRSLEETRGRLAELQARGERTAQQAAAARSESEALRARLAEERAARARAEAAGRAGKTPQIPGTPPAAAGAWLVALSPMRSGPGAGQPSQEITHPPSGWLVLALELELEDGQVYRAVLERQGGPVVWTGEDLRPGPEGGLAIGLDSSRLAPGVYRLRVEQKKGFPIARFTFQVSRP